MSPLTKKSQRDNLHKTLGSIADELRGKVDGWDFKTYVLGTLFYRYLCDHLVHIINTEQWEAGDPDFDYATLTDEEAESERGTFTENTRLLHPSLPAFCRSSHRRGRQR
ncbi:type I restriction-modification system subunit M N-terminal domain-containing protein [Corynebacterium diphtheriae]|uniref:type I restriction-modification system subunit M N-terminal domain-containing protein n=1 Tax=Corynebacterium diphtheriae TaxID=1717 RepID=UPI0015F52FA0|nr:type I restriction-modification system subunit M N-terminal domain-containing protein [Corynebacterium diphtheriae]